MSVFNTEELKTEINTIAKKTMDTSSPTPAPRRSILKTPSSTFKEIIEAEENNKFANADLIPRPHTVRIEKITFEKYFIIFPESTVHSY